MSASSRILIFCSRRRHAFDVNACTRLLLLIFAATLSVGQAAPTYRNLGKYQKATGTAGGWTLRPDLFATDGIASNFHRWRSINTTGQILDISYPRQVTIASAHLYLGVMASGTTTELWANFKFQYDSNGSWVDVPGGSVTSNTASERNVIFSSAVTSSKFRLLRTDSGNAILSVREIAMFGPNVVNSVEQGYPIGTEVCVNLAYKRPATASSINGTNYAIKAVDGYVDDSSRWLCNTGVSGEWLEVDLLSGNTNGDAYQAISSARLYSGDFATSNGALSDFTLQYWNTGTSLWADIPGATVTGNTQTVRTITFSSVVATNKVRLVNNTTGSAKIAELQFFPPSVASYPANQDVRIEAPPTAKAEDFSDATRHLRVSSASLKLGLVGGNAVFTHDAAGADALEWQLLLNHRDGSYRIRNVKNGQCLALANISTASNTLVIGETYTGMPHQCWFLDFVNASQFRLLNAYSGLALQSLGGSTTPGTALAVVTPGSSTLQQWDTVWQAHFPKKGIAGTGTAFPNFPGETYMSYYYGKFQHASWSYSWGGDDTFPFMGADHTFNPMWWGDYFWAHGGTYPPVEGNRNYMQSQGKPFSLLGFNEPDHTDQANMTVARSVALWPRMQSMDAPLVGPCPANPTHYWNADFYAAVNQLGYRVDYTPLHWYDSPSSTNFINKIKQLYTLYGRPIWVTEFSTVRWSGTATWTHASNYNFMAEFLWRAENLPELARYAHFNWKREPLSPIDPIEAPRGNAFDENDNLTPYGELYASWDGVAQVLPQKAYHLHNHGFYQRMQSPTSGNAFAFVTPDISSAGTQWFLTAGSTSNTWRIQTTRDGRPLVRAVGNPAAMGTLGQNNTATEWTLVPVVSGADHDGWYYLDHPLTNQRLKNNGDGTCTMVATTDTAHACKWRFIIPLSPDTKAVTDSASILANQSALIDVLANDCGRSGAPSIQSAGTPSVGTAVVENGKIRYTPPNGFSGSAQFNYTIADGAGTDTTTVYLTVVFNTPPTVDVGPNLSAAMSAPQAWTPAQITKELWLDGSDTSTFYDAVSGGSQVSANNAAIARWEDKSGNTRHATQATSTNRPLLQTNALNAKSVVDFDGSNDVLNVGGSAFATQNVFAVINYDGGTTFSNWRWVFGSKGTAPTDLVNPDVPALFGAQSSTNLASSLPNKNASSNTRYVNGVVSGSGNVADLITFDIVQASGASASPSRSNWLVGNGDGYWHGRFAELIVLGGAISTEDRQRMEGYLAHKWFGAGANNSLPADHIYKSIAPEIPITATATLNATVTDVENDSLTYSWSKVAGPGAVTFANASAKNTTATFSAIGTYTLRLTASDGISSPSDDIIITVKNQASVSAWPTAATIAEGQALSAATLSGGNASVAGTFTFDDPSATPALGTSSRAVTFTPTDSANYFSVSGTVSVTVQSAFDGWVDTNGTGSETFTGDSNGDAVADGMAWLIGATSPGQNALALLPAAQMSSNNLVLNFKRLNAAARGSALLKLEYGTLLTVGSWTSVSIPDEEGVVDGVQFSFTPDGGDHDQVQALVPVSKASGAGKLFVRLRAVAAPAP